MGAGCRSLSLPGHAPHPRGALADPRSSAAMHPRSSILPARERGRTNLGKGIKLLEGTYLPVGPSPRAAGEDSVAMHRELNFIITLCYLMSVSQAAGDVLMKLELHSL